MFNRRDLIIGAATSIGFPAVALAAGRPITCIVIGAGARGNIYASLAPQTMRVVGVAEPIPFRRERMRRDHGIEAKNCFTTWEHVFDGPKFADAVIIATPDNLHHGPTLRALNLGYDVLLEKPMATSLAHCEDIVAASRNRIVAVCHVLRYAPQYRAVKLFVEQGAVGDVISIQHLEAIGPDHFAHSFVRGNWRRAADVHSLVLTKSCHDMDLLGWIVGRPCRRVTSFGSLSFFRSERAPPNHGARCTDCAIERNCEFSAIKAYQERKLRLFVFDGLTADLRESQYGRCVWGSDNDVVDHQTVSLEFEGGVTASFSIAVGSNERRFTRIMGTRGELTSSPGRVSITRFDGTTNSWTPTMVASGHGGGDAGIVGDFLDAVSSQDPRRIISGVEVSMDSHRMAFGAEESRIKKATVAL